MLYRENGSTLLELIMVVAVVGFLVLLLGNIPSAIGLVGKSRHQSVAREIVAKQIEDQRAISYANLSTGTTTIVDSRLSSLPSGAGTILVETCPVTICTLGENAKQVTITVNWKERQTDQSVQLKTLIAEGGLNQ